MERTLELQCDAPVVHAGVRALPKQDVPLDPYPTATQLKTELDNLWQSFDGGIREFFGRRYRQIEDAIKAAVDPASKEYRTASGQQVSPPLRWIVPFDAERTREIRSALQQLENDMSQQSSRVSQGQWMEFPSTVNTETTI